MTMEKIIIGADHAGFQLKEGLKPFLAEMGFAVTDAGTDSDRPADYPDFASPSGRSGLHRSFPERDIDLRLRRRDVDHRQPVPRRAGRPLPRRRDGAFEPAAQRRQYSGSCGEEDRYENGPRDRPGMAGDPI